MAGIKNNMVHLGDGAYAEVEPDRGIWLAANHHNNRVLYLEPGALKILNEFSERKLKEFKAKRNG